MKPKESFSMRPATEDDLEQIHSIEREIHKIPWTLEHFQKELEKPYSHTLILTDDSTDTIIVGYIVYWALSENAEILDVGVPLAYRGLGHAKQLIRKTIQNCMRDGFKAVVLNVRKSNQPAIQLYHSTGFSISHVRKTFYSNGEDAYEMRTSLIEDGIRF